VAGSPFEVGDDPRSVNVDPTDKFVYVTNRASNNVSAFQIDPTTGRLTSAPGSPFPTGNRPFAMLVHPTGKFCYVVNLGSDSLSAFTIDPESGSLRPIPGSPFAAGTRPLFPTLDPAGKFLYASNQNSNDISAYAIDHLTGGLTPVPGSPFRVEQSALRGVRPREATVDPTGSFLYLLNRKTDTISAYKIDAESGALRRVDGSPFPPCSRKSVKYWWVLGLMVGKTWRDARYSRRRK
jgi:6-phosphogluconolactonase (cycloisomerase 2 family)